MKFSQMPYKRPKFEESNVKLEDLLKRFKEANTLEVIFDTYKEYDNYMSHISTMFNLASIRNTIDTKDEFYLAEKEYSDEVVPLLQPIIKEFSMALLECPFRKELEAEWGKLMFLNTEIELKTFKPEIVADLQEENRLSTEYDNLIASAEIDFDGQKLNLAQIRPYFESADREVRKASADAMSKWFIANADELDKIFDQLVKVRTRIAKTLGYESFTQLGYYRMQRNCYDEDMISKFRQGVIEHIVPVANKLKENQAKRVGLDKLNIYDDAFEYPDGNANPQGSPDDIFAHGKKMYH
ncbi:MAG: M3 family metallopeptidase, partial [Firmicutes bacterium]|nr:M3 family metallopeptidase [Bacillota bacterium]